MVCVMVEGNVATAGKPTEILLSIIRKYHNLGRIRMGCSRGWRWSRGVVAIALLGAAVPAFGVPAFARKYNLRCSDCHEAWPKLNNFGQTFKDNGYQLMTGRDAPIYQQVSYFPIAFPSIPLSHRAPRNRVAVDVIPGNPGSGQTEARI